MKLESFNSDKRKTKLWIQPKVLRLLFVALLAETGYAVLNISSMPVYLMFDRHFSASVIGFVLVGFLLSEAIFKSPMGNAADRIGRKKLIVLGPALTVVTALMTLVIPHQGGVLEKFLIFGLRILDGLGAAMLWPAAFALMSDTVEENKRQQGMSLLNMCYLVGIALALPLGGIVNDLAQEREASFYLAAVLFLIASLTALYFLPADKAKENTAHISEKKTSLLEELWLSAKTIPNYLLLAFITFTGIGFPMAIIKLFTEQQLGLSESQFGLIALPAALAMAFLSVPMSHLGSKLGPAKAVHFGKGMCILGLWVTCSGAFLQEMRQPWILGISVIPIAIGFLLAIPAWYTSVAQLNSVKKGSLIGAVMTAQGIGTTTGAPIGAYFYDKLQFINKDFGRYSPFIGCALCITLGWILSLKIIQDQKFKK